MPLFPLQSHHQRLTDSAEYTLLMKGPWDLQFEQLSAGFIQLENRGVSFGNAFLYHETYNREVIVRGCLEEGVLAFSLPSNRTRQSRWWGAPCPENTLIVGSPSLDIFFSTDQHYSNFVALVSEADFYKAYQNYTGESPDFLKNDSPYLELSPQAMKQLEQDWSDLVHKKRTFLRNADFCERLAQAIAQTQAYQTKPLISSLQQSKKVREAISLWKASDYALSVLEVSQLIGINKRSLEHAFKRQLDHSPYQYLKRHRLNIVRRALLTADPSQTTVTEIAMKFGFYELGRFAVYYRQLFGEKPSETLKFTQSSTAFFTREASKTPKTMPF